MARSKNDEDERVERLLAGGYLSGSQYDAIEQRVLARTAKPRMGQVFRWVAPGALAVASVAALAVLLVRKPPEFNEKGTDASLGVFDVSCKRPLRHTCGSGETLAFLVNSALASGYLGAYAERVDDPSHSRIWYFPNAQGESPYIGRSSQTVVLPSGIRVGPEHRQGRYRVTLWLSAKPLSRAQVERADASLFVARSSLMTEIVP